jgi:hypothetical protein
MASLVCLRQVTDNFLVLHLIAIEFVLEAEPFDLFVTFLLLQISIVNGASIQTGWRSRAQPSHWKIESPDGLR